MSEPALSRRALEFAQTLVQMNTVSANSNLALIDFVRDEYGARWGEDSDGTCRAPGCCGTPMPTCDEIRAEWEAPEDEGVS